MSERTSKRSPADAPTLGISGWRLHGQRTGVGRYILSVLDNLSHELVAGRFSDIRVYTPRPLTESGVALLPNLENKVLPSALPMVAWDNFRLGPVADEDVVFYPSFSRPFITRGATVVATHDATMRVVPHMYTKRDRIIYDPLYGWSARAATLVITTSEAAKRDIVREWKVDPEKIRVTPLAAAASFYPLGGVEEIALERRKLIGADVPYFFFAGKISGRRNLPELLDAFTRFKRAGHPHKLVMVGPAYAVEAARSLAASGGIADHFITFSYVTDDVLNKLYNCAQAFIMPSAYENGSLPVFEAQATGTPVVSVWTEGTFELTGGEALLIPKLEVGALVEAMTRIAEDEALRTDLSRRGLENSRRYSWQRCATETLAACVEAVNIYGR